MMENMDQSLPIFSLDPSAETVTAYMRPVEARILAMHGYGMMPIGGHVHLMSAN